MIDMKLEGKRSFENKLHYNASRIVGVTSYSRLYRSNAKIVLSLLKPANFLSCYFTFVYFVSGYFLSCKLV